MNGRERINAWFDERGWTPFPFQEETWSVYSRGQSGLVHAPTGLGKTLAVWCGPLIEWLDQHPDSAQWSPRAAPPL